MTMAAQPSAEGFYRVHLTQSPVLTPAAHFVRSTITVETRKANCSLCAPLYPLLFTSEGAEP